jgi:hypothetical protein
MVSGGLSTLLFPLTVAAMFDVDDVCDLHITGWCCG